MTNTQEAVTSGDYLSIVNSLGTGLLHEHLISLACLVDCNIIPYSFAKSACDILVMGEILSVSENYL